MSQWCVAALQPQSLKASCLWEGPTDMLCKPGYQDGVPEKGFVGGWWRFRVRPGLNRHFSPHENFLSDRGQRLFANTYWASQRLALERIEVPTPVCANWSDHGLHTRGQLEGFAHIASADKWLYTHGGRKWESFYSPEMCDTNVCSERQGLCGLPRTLPRLRLSHGWRKRMRYSVVSLSTS
jgi:hypothetical protein